MGGVFTLCVLSSSFDPVGFLPWAKRARVGSFSTNNRFNSEAKTGSGTATLPAGEEGKEGRKGVSKERRREGRGPESLNSEQRNQVSPFCGGREMEWMRVSSVFVAARSNAARIVTLATFCSTNKSTKSFMNSADLSMAKWVFRDTKVN